MTREFVLALLSAGGATFVWTLTKSIIAWRNSAEGREDKAIGRLEKYEADCRAELAHERQWSSYWALRSAVLERTLLKNDIAVPPRESEPTRN